MEEADTIRREALRLAEEDTVAYAAVLDAFRADHNGEVERRRAVRAALSEAIDVPLAVVERGHRVAKLGVPVALDGNPNLRGDAITGVHLADAAARTPGVEWAVAYATGLTPISKVSTSPLANACGWATSEISCQMSRSSNGSSPHQVSLGTHSTMPAT